MTISGETDHLNVGGKAYFLLYDTDIDFMFLSGRQQDTPLRVRFLAKHRHQPGGARGDSP